MGGGTGAARNIDGQTTMGDPSEGFSVEVDAGNGFVRVRCWGFWGLALCREFSAAVVRGCTASHRQAHLLIDVADLKPMREEGQAAFAAAMIGARRCGVAGISLLTGSQLTKLQLLRIVRESSVRDTVRFVGRGG